MKISDIRHYLFYSACVAVFGLGVCIYGYMFDTAQSAVTIGDDHILHLETTSIELLPPHGHEIGKDSLQDPGHHVGVTSSVITAPTDLWVTGISYEVVGAPAFTLHHGTLFRLDARDLQCPTQSPQPLVSVSQDQAHTNHMRFADGYGIFIP